MITLIAGAPDFLEKYFIKEFAARAGVEEEKLNTLRFVSANHPEEYPAQDVNLIFISSTDVYGLKEGEQITEETPLDPKDNEGEKKAFQEHILTEWANRNNVILTILRCPMIMGTGMEGRLRDLVNSIWRGTYFHINGETAKSSIIHAVDVARAAAELADRGGVFNLTDGIDHTDYDLTEAIAFRLDQKRIFTISERKARLYAKVADWIPLFGFTSKRLAERYVTLTFSNEKIAAVLPWKINDVVEYLRNHKYDENSL